ncbi:MAG: ATP-binding cassette domain-containing protein [Planctomycetota bacterium]
MTGHAVRLEGVHFRRPGPEGFEVAAHSLRVSPGEVVALVGPSGSGKSTLLQLISGELVPGDGAVHVAGENISSQSEADRRRLRLQRIGVVAQTLSLIEYLNGIENILLAATLLGRARDERGRAKELAARLEVTHVLRRRPARMSQGERQRIAVCRALLMRPPVLLCDEPTGNLDAQRGSLAVELMLAAARSHDAAVVIATHDDRVLPYADRVVEVASLSEKAQSAEPAGDAR